MKKWILGILGAAGVLMLGAGIYTKLKGSASSASSISIIGGADGPTSIFLAGKVGGDYSLFLIIAGILVLGISILLYIKRRK